MKMTKTQRKLIDEATQYGYGYVVVTRKNGKSSGTKSYQALSGLIQNGRAVVSYSDHVVIPNRNGGSTYQTFFRFSLI